MYAAKHGLSLRALYRWRGHARREGRLEPAPGERAAAAGARVASREPVGLPNGCTVELNAPLDGALLRALLRETAAL